MSTPTEQWKRWEGRVVDDKFPLRQWLGGSDHSAVFLTAIGESRKAAIKLVFAKNVDEEVQLSRWAASKVSHPHLIRLFASGRCQIDGTRLLYVVMEYADEDLGQILPLRPLDPAEASEMLRPTAEALASLHRAGLVHGSIKPSNIMAVGNQLKISVDGVCKIWDRADARARGPYDAPEIATVGLSSEGDIWSLGMTLVAVLTQNEPKNGNRAQVAVPETIPQPFREIARQCLQINPQQRCTVGDVLGQLGAQTGGRREKAVEIHGPQEHKKGWIIVAIALAAILLGALVAGKFILRQAPAPASETQPAVQPSANTSSAQSPVPFATKEKNRQHAIARGGVAQQVPPEVSRGALNTITGSVKVTVKVEVDPSGNVSQASLVSPGPSHYFANRSLAAARRWKFTPPQVDGKPVASEWSLRFQFQRTSAQTFPTETKP